MNKVEISAPYSYSQLNIFMTCPAQLLYYKDKTKKQEESRLLQVGNYCHQVLEKYVLSLNEAGLNRELDIFENSVYQVNIPDNIKDEVYKICLNWIKYFKLELSTFHSVELNLAVNRDWQPCDYWDKKAYFRGKVDRLHIVKHRGGLISAQIVDYKTGFGKEVDKFQFIIYAMLVQANMDFVKEFRVSAEFVRQFTIIDADITNEEIEACKEKINKTVKQIASSEYLEKLNPLCNQCGYQGYCETYKKAMVNDKWAGIPINDLANLYLLQKDNIKAMADKLKEHISKYGNIKFSDGKELILDSEPTEQIQDIKAFKLAFEKCDNKKLKELDYYCKETLSNARLKAKVFKEDPDFSKLWVKQAKTPVLKLKK